MAELAIAGHETRGKEVIDILEMLGGKIHRDRFYSNNANNICSWYYIDKDGYIEHAHQTSFNDITNSMGTTFFTLEGFLEKYPYKVGDKALINYDMKENVYTIKSMVWNTFFKCVTYRLETIDFYGIVDYHDCFADDMKRYLEQKEEIMEVNIDITLAPDLKGKDYSGRKFGYKIPNGYEFECVRENEIILKPIKTQYPKTYCECCDVLQVGFIYDLKDLTKDEAKLMDYFIGLKRCRDAYWKVYGEEMGLGKPWKPENPTKYYIFTIENNGSDIIKNAITDKWRNRFLVFPTEEMRDVFYENFRYLIDGCKELL
jgi:hypothetical protein